MRRRQRIFVMLLLLALFPVLLRAQAQAGPMVRPVEPASSYENSAAGLRLQLQEASAAARNHDRSRLEFLIRQMEIPNSEAWFTKFYGPTKGESRTELYGQELANRERDLEAAFVRFGLEAGQFQTRKVNDAPEPGVEAGMIAELQQPADIFYAGWRKQESPSNAKDEPIGYFVFLEGRFRWDSTIAPLKILQYETRNRPLGQGNLSVTQMPVDHTVVLNRDGIASPGANEVRWATCVYCPDPAYPQQARKKQLQGLVVLTVMVEIDGTGDNIELVKASDPIFVDSAIEAVKRWRFKPAIDRNGQPVAAKVPIEISFRPPL